MPRLLLTDSVRSWKEFVNRLTLSCNPEEDIEIDQNDIDHNIPSRILTDFSMNRNKDKQLILRGFNLAKICTCIANSMKNGSLKDLDLEEMIENDDDEAETIQAAFRTKEKGFGSLYVEISFETTPEIPKLLGARFRLEKGDLSN
mmetsp:Transcript_14207/g.27137  ORF Transcript_14207/g.27137 Transcript_14207/m.27137 type:complete len:145 (+) Transcript_14207:319-753(+)